MISRFGQHGVSNDPQRQALELHIGRRKTGISIHPDPTYAGMWRVHHGDRVSDMVNLTGAKEAAITWARPRGLGSGAHAHWHTRETPLAAAYSALQEAAE